LNEWFFGSGREGKFSLFSSDDENDEKNEKRKNENSFPHTKLWLFFLESQKKA